MVTTKAQLKSGLGNYDILSLHECLELEVKYLYCGQYQELIERVKSEGTAYQITQHYLRDEFSMLSQFFLTQVSLEDPGVKEQLQILRVRARRIQSDQGVIHLLQLKCLAPAKIFEGQDENSPHVLIELNSEIEDSLYSELIARYSLGSVSKTRYLVPLKDLSLDAEIDFLQGNNDDPECIRVITADVEYQTPDQKAILLNPREIAQLTGFEPVEEHSAVRSVLMNLAWAPLQRNAAGKHFFSKGKPTLW